MLLLLRARNFQQFHQSLRGWGTPPMNFVYADREGNVGIVNAGYGPQVASGSPWLPLSGTGESDVTGSVPFDALPITYDPPSGYVSAANDREVTPDYPYYWGRSYDFFDQGWRQEQAAQSLATGAVTAAQMAQLNLSHIDALAPSLVPSLLAALDGQPLNAAERSARNLFAAWRYDVSPDSAAATIWQRFILLYDYDVLHPIWTYYKISAPPITPGALPEEFGSGPTPSPLVGGFADDSLQGLLAQLTSTDPSNAIFSPPNVPKRTAADVLRQAFSESVKELAAQRGTDPSTWRYGDQHFAMMTSLLKSSTLDAGPYSYGGDGYTIDALLSNPIVRGGKPLAGVNRGGSSWRYVMDWGTGSATSSFPGGTSENPASPWYDNGIADWLAGKYRPMLSGDAAMAASKGRIWTLMP
jgi:penicillin amidase